MNINVNMKFELIRYNIESIVHRDREEKILKKKKRGKIKNVKRNDIIEIVINKIIFRDI